MNNEKEIGPGSVSRPGEGSEEQSSLSIQAVADVSEDETIGKKYKVVKALDKGGMAEIYKVYDRLEREYKAIKIVPQAAYGSEALEHLRTEINISKKISHPNVIRVYDLLEDRGRYFLVMEYIDGKNLYQLLKASPGKRLNEYDVIEYMIQVSKGLKEIHRRGVIHLDLKPRNIMITVEGETKILDFSISKMIGELVRTRLQGGYARGTLPYMAPEQLSRSYGKESEQTDIWSLGATMYHLLSGEYPFGTDKKKIRHPQGKPSGKKINHVSSPTKNFVVKCLQKNSTERYKDMGEVLKELNKIKTYLKKNKGAPPGGDDAETTQVDSRSAIRLQEDKSTPGIFEGNGHIESPGKRPPGASQRLSKTEVIKLIKEKGFFDSNWNKNGGLKNKFELKSVSSAPVVIDAAAGLMWHPAGSPGFMGLERANRWLEELNESGYAGFSDWRLPDLEEAASLLQKRKDKSSFYIDPGFSREQQCIYTGDGTDDNRVWLVDFKEGNVYLDFPNYGYIRPVRSLDPGLLL
jgi:serine/threonine-protein kinase